ncbi:hypothetical protein SteCoe_31323 [Stentor coeruleus]|uniref:Palmitoyltransferase n=1 Tax=Stentor coeruleus TaxID=5963 RepID=A0A1R2B1I7_9CILI|nr:hypothetical protein SteCoe_31323 [Stentor coeruleus]
MEKNNSNLRGVFCCNKKIRAGPELQRVLITFVMTIAPQIVFYVSNALYLKKCPEHIVISSLLFMICIFLMIKLVISNPGFMLAKDISKSVENFFKESPSRSYRFQSRYASFTQQARIQHIKYCRVCNILRPFRTSHCRICGVCVEKYDHHCPWLGNCIGKYNYKDFLLFLFAILGLISYDFYVSITYLYEDVNNIKIKVVIENYGGTIFISAYSGIVRFMQLFFFISALISFHLYLVYKNITTHEYFTKAWQQPRYNPYNIGFFRNAYMICFGIKMNLSKRKAKQLEITPFIFSSIGKKDKFEVLSNNITVIQHKAD